MIIDTHGHIQDRHYPAGSNIFVEPEKMLDVMDRYEIDEIWLSPSSGLVRDFELYNKKTYDTFVHCYPDRFKGYAVVNPYFVARMRKELKRCFELYGFLGIKIHSWLQGFVLHQPVMYEIMELAGRYEVPVMFHDGTPPYAETLQIAALAERFPEVQILLGHSGLYDAYHSAVQASQTHNNIWLILLGPAISDMRKIITNCEPKRLLFGTDYCCAGSGWEGETLIPDRIDMVRYALQDSNSTNLIFYENAIRLLNHQE